jgi:hypothetical protein
MHIDKRVSSSLPAMFESTVIIVCCIMKFSWDKYILRCLIPAASLQYATIRIQSVHTQIFIIANLKQLHVSVLQDSHHQAVCSEIQTRKLYSCITAIAIAIHLKVKTFGPDLAFTWVFENVTSGNHFYNGFCNALLRWILQYFTYCKNALHKWRLRILHVRARSRP